ncbi:MAG TPA: hypothetical protein VFQ61_00750, partial [Polyangiaceae bacterium]|nr:hypothetical protein [Polyangiaceae bacterium]
MEASDESSGAALPLQGSARLSEVLEAGWFEPLLNALGLAWAVFPAHAAVDSADSPEPEPLFQNDAYRTLRGPLREALRKLGESWPGTAGAVREVALGPAGHWRWEVVRIPDQRGGSGWVLQRCTDISELVRERTQRADAAGRLRLLSAHTQG